jgi:hypothetical protein
MVCSASAGGTGRTSGAGGCGGREDVGVVRVVVVDDIRTSARLVVRSAAVVGRLPRVKRRRTRDQRPACGWAGWPDRSWPAPLC